MLIPVPLHRCEEVESLFMSERGVMGFPFRLQQQTIPSRLSIRLIGTANTVWIPRDLEGVYHLLNRLR